MFGFAINFNKNKINTKQTKKSSIARTAKIKILKSTEKIARKRILSVQVIRSFVCLFVLLCCVCVCCVFVGRCGECLLSGANDHRVSYVVNTTTKILFSFIAEKKIHTSINDCVVYESITHHLLKPGTIRVNERR